MGVEDALHCMKGEVGGVLRWVLYFVCLRTWVGSGAMSFTRAWAGGKVMGLSKRGGWEGALAFATGEAVAVPASMISNAVNAGCAVRRRVDTWLVCWVSGGGAVRGLLWWEFWFVQWV